jgi:hypothetical protein
MSFTLTNPRIENGKGTSKRPLNLLRDSWTVWRNLAQIGGLNVGLDLKCFRCLFMLVGLLNESAHKYTWRTEKMRSAPELEDKAPG